MEPTRRPLKAIILPALRAGVEVRRRIGEEERRWSRESVNSKLVNCLLQGNVLAPKTKKCQWMLGMPKIARFVLLLDEDDERALFIQASIKTKSLHSVYSNHIYAIPVFQLIFVYCIVRETRLMSRGYSQLGPISFLKVRRKAVLVVVVVRC
jgi:hypothetical protein